MIPIDHFDKWASTLDSRADQVLKEAELRAYQAIPAHERLNQLKALLEAPIAWFSPVNDVFFRSRWAEVLQAVRPPQPLALLEIASGDADMIPQMMACTYPHSHYITANMNRMLTAGLRRKTEGLPVEITVIEEDAVAINRHLGPSSVDVIAFQHAVNDVIQAILCDREGIDTIFSDWMETLPAMITILQRELANGTLEQHAKPGFLFLLDNLLKVLKKDGVMVMNHYMYQLDLDWGYPPGLWENMIPMTRMWVKDLPGCQEVYFDGFDPQWWMFIRRS